MPRRKQFGKRKCHPNQFVTIKRGNNVDNDQLDISAQSKKLISVKKFLIKNVIMMDFSVSVKVRTLLLI